MKVGKLTLEQKEQIAGQEFTDSCRFRPIEDLNNNWVISLEEMNGRVTNPDFFWVRDLPKITYKPKPEEEK
jgi:hypothetical protein